VTDQLVVEFAVETPAAHAFEVWTSRVETWWPPSHTFSGDPVAIVVEPRAGGRIVEVARDGREREWGEVLDWEPPTHVRYLWHLFFDRDEATEVDVRFTETAGRTAVRLQQTGWDRLGHAGRDRSLHAWTPITPHYVAACAAGWAARPAAT
jgi:hypothetical protein